MSTDPRSQIWLDSLEYIKAATQHIEKYGQYDGAGESADRMLNIARTLALLAQVPVEVANGAVDIQQGRKGDLRRFADMFENATKGDAL